jgi:hypothetical protein
MSKKATKKELAELRAKLEQMDREGVINATMEMRERIDHIRGYSAGWKREFCEVFTTEELINLWMEAFKRFG